VGESLWFSAERVRRVLKPTLEKKKFDFSKKKFDFSKKKILIFFSENAKFFFCFWKTLDFLCPSLIIELECFINWSVNDLWIMVSEAILIAKKSNDVFTAEMK